MPFAPASSQSTEPPSERVSLAFADAGDFHPANGSLDVAGVKYRYEASQRDSRTENGNGDLAIELALMLGSSGSAAGSQVTTNRSSRSKEKDVACVEELRKITQSTTKSASPLKRQSLSMTSIATERKPSVVRVLKFCGFDEVSAIIAKVLRALAIWSVGIVPMCFAMRLDTSGHPSSGAQFYKSDAAIGILYAVLAALEHLFASGVFEHDLLAKRGSLIGPGPKREGRFHILHLKTFWMDVISLLSIPWLLGVPPIGGVLGVAEFRPLALLRAWRVVWDEEGAPFNGSDVGQQEYFSFAWVIFSLYLSCHYYGCIWLIAMDYSGGATERGIAVPGDDVFNFWIEVDFIGAGLLTGINAPDPVNDAERLVLAVLFPISATVVAVLFAKLVMVSSRISVIVTRRHEQLSYIRSATAQLGIRRGLRKKIMKYHSFLQQFHDKELYRAVLDPLPQGLHIEIKLQLFEGFICCCDLLSNLDARCIEELVLAFEEFTFCPGDLVIECGTMGDTMYLVVRGVCHVLDDQDNFLAAKQAGDYFGEVSLLFPVKRTANVRASTFCVIAQLTREKFERVIKDGSPERQFMLARVQTFTNINNLPPPNGMQESNSVPLITTEQRSILPLERSKKRMLTVQKGIERAKARLRTQPHLALAVAAAASDYSPGRRHTRLNTRSLPFISHASIGDNESEGGDYDSPTFRSIRNGSKLSAISSIPQGVEERLTMLEQRIRSIESLVSQTFSVVSRLSGEVNNLARSAVCPHSTSISRDSNSEGERPPRKGTFVAISTEVTHEKSSSSTARENTMRI